MTGIYSITCTANDRCYIGSARDIAARWQLHVWHLNRNKHHSRKFQASWNKYGATQFTFAVLTLCSQNQLLEAEQVFLDIFGSAGRSGFNCAPKAGSNAGCKYSVEARRRMSLSRRGKRPASYDKMRDGFERWSKSNREQLLENAARAREAIRGTKWTPERRAKTMASKKPFSIDARRRISAASAARRHDSKAKEKMRLATLQRWERFRANGGTGRLARLK